MNIYETLNVFKNSKSICLIAHIGPDPDAIASMIVFRSFLQKHFRVKRVDIFAETNIIASNLIEILGNVTLNGTPTEYDTAVMMDCPNTERLGKYKTLFENAQTTIVIDHHATNNYSGDINIVEMCSSTCEIVYAILKEFNYKISDENQGKIYAGIITDTNNFTVGNITKRTFQFASKINDHINRDEIYKAFLANNSLKNMQFLSIAIQNISAYEHNQIILSHLSKSDAYKYNGIHEDFLGIVNKLSTISSAKLVCFIEPREDSSFYVSMRAKDNFDVSIIAKKYGGGGHIGAAAFNSNDSLDNIKETILNEFREQLKSVKTKKIKLF